MDLGREFYRSIIAYAMLVTVLCTLYATPGFIIHRLSINNDPFQYSGQYTDAESKLQYLNARYYNADISRFVSRDTFQLTNRYNYADGNPITNADPSGHNAIDKLFGPAQVGIILGFIGLQVALAPYMLNRQAMIEMAGLGKEGLEPLISAPNTKFFDNTLAKEFGKDTEITENKIFVQNEDGTDSNIVYSKVKVAKFKGLNQEFVLNHTIASRNEAQVGTITFRTTIEKQSAQNIENMDNAKKYLLAQEPRLGGLLDSIKWDTYSVGASSEEADAVPVLTLVYNP